jgi:hypothetical protein
MMQGSTHELIEHRETPLGFFHQQGRPVLADLAAGIVANKVPRVAKVARIVVLDVGIDE